MLISRQLTAITAHINYAVYKTNVYYNTKFNKVQLGIIYNYSLVPTSFYSAAARRVILTGDGVS